ncbi:MAG TPA: hypothetical protein VFA11_13795 [Acidimicrobiales bacterium]|nr:hypothetical protein [Acidimicrobiales bacterium]
MTQVVSSTTIFVGSTGAAKEKDIENFGLLAELFRQGQQRGEVRAELNPLQLAEILTSIYMLTITNWTTSWWGDPGELRPRLDSALDVFLTGSSSVTPSGGRGRRNPQRSKTAPSSRKPGRR